MSMGKPGVAHTRSVIFSASFALERRSTISVLPSSLGTMTSFRFRVFSSVSFMSSMG